MDSKVKAILIGLLNLLAIQGGCQHLFIANHIHLAWNQLFMRSGSFFPVMPNFSHFFFKKTSLFIQGTFLDLPFFCFEQGHLLNWKL